METEAPLDAKAKAKAKAKRARKRSRYLSPPYTYTFTDDDIIVCGHGHGHGSKELVAACTNVAAADMLSALHAAALLDMDAAANLEVLCRFFTLHRDTGTSSSRVTAEGGLLLSPSSNTQNKDKEEETTSPNKKKMKKNAASSPTTRLPLTDVRKNLEQMISSLLGHGHGAKLALAGEMRGLLAKVDKMLAAGPAAATTPTAHGSPLN